MSRLDLMHVHINKCAGKSLRQGMGITFSPRHLTAAEYRKKFPSLWRVGFKFAFVRNPYTRIVSSYEYKKRMGYDKISEDDLSFKEWFFRCINDREYTEYKYYAPCAYWLTIDGELAVDNIYRFERFDSEVERLRMDVIRYGYPGFGKIPHINKNTNPRSLLVYYDDEVLEAVTQFYMEDFELFDYEPELMEAL